MEAGEHGLTRGTWVFARRLEVVAVIGLMWGSWCVFDGARCFLVFLFRFVFCERTRPAASMRPPCLIYVYTITGVRTGCHYFISLSVCLSVYLCVTFVVFTDCESCTRPISTNSGSMQAGEHGLTRGTWVVARRLDVVAVSGMMWVSWCVFGGAGFFTVFE